MVQISANGGKPIDAAMLLKLFGISDNIMYKQYYLFLRLFRGFKISNSSSGSKSKILFRFRFSKFVPLFIWRKLYNKKT